LLLAAVILAGPPASVVGLLLGARGLSKRGAPRYAIGAAYLLAAIVCLTVLWGYGGAVLLAMQSVAGEEVDPSQKARVLAEGISEVMNCGALALLIALVPAGWIGFWMWKRRGGGPDE
jgi:hypothetical protein